MTNITEIDFGADERAKKRDFQEKLDSLLARIKRRDDDYLNNPKKFFSMIGEEIHARDDVIQRANDALHPTPVQYSDYLSFLTLSTPALVDADELDRLRACAKIVEEWANR